MSESIVTADFYNPLPTREERMRVFIGDLMSADDRDMAHSLAISFEDPERPMQKTAVLIPVAAHQDGDHIFHTLGEYAKQRGCDPFTVFLHLNAPDHNDINKLAGIGDSLAAVQKAKQAFPDLDIRATMTTYSDPIIGEIRRDTWNGALLLAYHEGLFSSDEHDVIGINNDIDTHFISPHYIARIQEYYKKRQSQANKVNAPRTVHAASGTRLTHAVLDSHPNVGKVTTWIDSTYFQAVDHSSYEAGIVIPFSLYASLGGFNQKDATYETSWVHPDSSKRLHHIAGAQLYTSPRRYVDRLAEHGSGSDGIWAPGSFGPNDPCRAQLRPDISIEQAEDLILERLSTDLQDFWLRRAIEPISTSIKHAPLTTLHDPAYKTFTQERAHTSVSKQLQKAERLLRKVIGSDVLADIVRDGFDGDKHADGIVTSLIVFNRVSEEILTETERAKELFIKLN
jgi:hypothetical protein